MTKAKYMYVVITYYFENAVISIQKVIHTYKVKKNTSREGNDI